MLFPNSNPLIAYFMNRSLYKKVTQELCKLLKYVANVMEHMKEGREFDTEREYEKYVQDLSKGIEMLHLLLEANLYHRNAKNGRVDRFFATITDKMSAIVQALTNVKVFIPNSQGEEQVNTFFNYDFAFPVFDAAFHPILPEFIDTKENMLHVAEAKREINEFIDLCLDKIVNKKCCMPSSVFCYFEQLEYILSYNYNAVKFEAPSLYDSHKVPMMFFPAHGKHMSIDREVISKYGKNVTITFEEGNKDSISCVCKNNDKPTIILWNPNALWYEQMVNYPHNFWLKYFMNLGNNVVVWNYRGYGSNKGSPTPYNIKRDGEAVVNFCLKTLKLKGRLAIYGRSLGGIVACHLGRHVKGIDMLIADRTLASLETLTKRKMYGKFIHHAFNFFSCGWEVDNDINFLESKVQWKILTWDPSDDVIDIFSSLYTGVALRYFEKERSIESKIEAIKHEIFFNEDVALFNAIKGFFNIYELLAYALKKEDKLTIESKVNKGLASQLREEIKSEPLNQINKKSVEKSKEAKDNVTNLKNVRYVNSREYLQQHFDVQEGDYQHSIPALFNNYVKPFRNTFAWLNAGILTIYEIFHQDHISSVEDLRLFLVFLEIYGTGRALRPNGEYVSICTRRKNSVKKIDLIITELMNLNEGEVEANSHHKALIHLLRKLSDVIIEGFKVMKKYVEEKNSKDGIMNSSRNPELDNHRIHIESEEDDKQDQEKCIKNPPERYLGFVMPMRCGHRGYPKEKDKEKKALDIFLHHNGFISRTRWDQEKEEDDKSDSD